VQRYFLTICTRDRAPVLTDDRTVSLVLDQFLYTAKEQQVAVVAYCVMPDHLHLLVDGEREDADLKKFVTLAKQRAGYRFKARVKRALWQDGYYEHVLRDEETTESIVYYIIANPLRKGLVDNLFDYQFWGSGSCSREELVASIGLHESRT
jgi:putative transposase